MQLVKIMAAAVLAALLSKAAVPGGSGQDSVPSSDAATSRGFSMHSRDSAGNGSTLVDNGNGCMIMSTPNGSISSGC